MEVHERAQALEREGREIIHLEVGEPDFETPACIRETVTPGIDFGANAERYLRFSYANSLEKIAAAMDWLGAYLQAR